MALNISKKYVTVEQLSRGYSDTIDGGIVAYDGKLNVRPPYQREFVYNDKQREAVIQSIIKNCPIGVFNWGKSDVGGWEIIDGQQRTISICDFIAGRYSIKYDNRTMTFANIKASYPELAQQILSYELMLYVCNGTNQEKLEWFRTINIAGEKLTDQEILNAVYSGQWLSMCKENFSKKDCAAKKLGDKYVSGNPIRQEILEQVFSWKADDEGLNTIEDYMSKHQNDNSIDNLWNYYRDVIQWARTLFPTYYKGISDKQAWGILYNKYKDNTYNASDLDEDIRKLILDDDVTKKSGIIEYVLSGYKSDKVLSIRAFSESMKQKKYIEQGGICPICGEHHTYEEMEGDHITPWSEGGHTTYDNLQMLCKECNRRKSNK